MKPLVSILIPAYNAQEWISDTIRSALAQTWPNTEIIVVDDGSKDGTLATAGKFASAGVKIVTQQNQGAPTARNKAFSLSRGDYIQWLDADDLLAPDKISEQMKLVESMSDDRFLFTGNFSPFYFNPAKAKVATGPLMRDLSPLDYFYLKFEQDKWLQTACWLVSRKLTEKAGPWLDLRSPDDDGEYFCRVVAASNGIIFVPTSNLYYRVGNISSLSNSRQMSVNALRGLLETNRRCIACFRALEESDRSRKACVTFLRNRLIYYYPDQQEMLNQIYALAGELGGTLSKPPLLPHYEIVRALLGWNIAKRAQDFIPTVKRRVLRSLDKIIYNFSKAGSN